MSRPAKTMLFTCMILLCAATALAQTPTSIFQLNGDPASDGSQCAYPGGSATCDYWNLINEAGSSGTGRGHSSLNTFLNGTTNTNNFTGGGSKDPNDLNQWAYTSTNTPNKDTLNAAYAAAYSAPDFEVIFGADRLSPSGDANIGIWFFQESVGTLNGKFVNTADNSPAHHIKGDVFIVSAFVGGGGTSQVQAYEWDPACTSAVKNPGPGDCAASNLRVLSSTASDAFAITNSKTVTATWASYSGNSLISPLFFEGGFDVTNAFSSTSGAGNAPCFASFLVETRSSQSPTAVLKDFLLGGFPVCSMSITKSCGTSSVSADGTSFTYPVNGTVTNSGIGTLFNVQVKDCINGANNTCTATANSPISVVNNTTGSANIGTNTLAAGESGTWTDSSTSSATSQSDQAYAIAALSSGGTQTLQSTNTASATCTAQAVSTLTVSKACSTSLQTGASGAPVSVKVSYGGTVCNTGPSKVTGITLTDYPDSVAITSGTNGATVLSSVTLNPGTVANPTCVSYGSPTPLTYTPTAIDETIGTGAAAGTGAGRYFFDDLITISSATASVGTLTQFQNSNPQGANYNPDGRINGTYGFQSARCPMCAYGECAAQ